MSIEASTAVHHTEQALSSGAMGPEQELLDQSQFQSQEFEQVLTDLRSAERQDVVQLAADQQLQRVDKTDTAYAAMIERVAEPGGVERLLGDVQHGHERMRHLLSELRSGKSYSNQQLLAIQSEVYDLTMNLQVSTRVITEVVSNVKQLLTQQI